MVNLVVRRLLSSIPVLLIVSGIVFLLTTMVSGDPARTLAGEDATEEQVEATRERLNLNEPLIMQYLIWLQRAITGDLGTSLFSSESVVGAIATRVPVTLSLTFGALVLAIIIGIPAGIAAATHRGKLVDRIVTLVTSLGLATPNYFLGLLLVLALAINSSFFPATGYVPLEQDPSRWFLHLVLPWFTLSLATAAVIARQLRSSLASVLELDYVRSARAKGLRENSVVLKHGLKNAMIPVNTVIGTQVAILLSGSVLIEQIFGLPGLGSLAVTAALGRDVPLLQGVVLFGTLMVLATNLLVDLSYGWLNPKVRAS